MLLLFWSTSYFIQLLILYLLCVPISLLFQKEKWIWLNGPSVEKYKSSSSGSWSSGSLGSINGPRINGSPLARKGEDRQIL